ncbi:CHRD domain-containing protein [Lacibacter sp. H375]|uniref:CHRD domain-containing protein n=1 Tax=Lacibacter sp. H375 TaxID=3133424 RepID=UPI0030BB4908
MSEKSNQFLSEQSERQTSSLEQISDDAIVFTQVVQLEGSQEVPAANTETKGIAILRVSKSKKLYSKIIIQKLAEGDALRFAHIHMGAAGVNGPVRIGLADNASQFGVNRTIQLTDAQFTLLTEGACYVNAHSNFFPGGIVRGQIR